VDTQQITDCCSSKAGGAHPLFILHSLIVTEKYDQLTCKTVNNLRTSQLDVNLLISDTDMKINRKIGTHKLIHNFGEYLVVFTYVYNHQLVTTVFQT
jgi:hypothetical protein